MLNAGRTGLQPVILHVSAGDYAEVTLQEYKVRTYISVFEEGAYVPRLKCDEARWRFALREVINDRAHITYTAFCTAGKMSPSQLNLIASMYAGGEGMFTKMITAYQWENETRKAVFASQLPI